MKINKYCLINSSINIVNPKYSTNLQANAFTANNISMFISDAFQQLRRMPHGVLSHDCKSKSKTPLVNLGKSCHRVNFVQALQNCDVVVYNRPWEHHRELTKFSCSPASETKHLHKRVSSSHGAV